LRRCGSFEPSKRRCQNCERIAGSPACFILGIGQEGIAVGVCSALQEDDVLYTGHRGHAYFVAKGADLGRLMAEIVGRRTGYCAGKGGSMHPVAAERGLLGATGIVGGALPLALGSAFACRERGRQQVAVVTFGDGASNAPTFHESLNIASLWKLPVVFVCENNGYAAFTPTSAHTVVERVSDHAAPYRIPSMELDGNDVLAVRRAMDEAVTRARSGAGCTFLECRTYRLRGHYEGDPEQYRQLSEMREWKEKDPIASFASQLEQAGQLTDTLEREIEGRMRKQVEDAASFALDSPPPSADEMTDYVFA
jgi:TPP-dependent pyruvate/acetoin dehydrogenase alpha subunit